MAVCCKLPPLATKVSVYVPLFSKLIVATAVPVEFDRVTEAGEIVQVECRGPGPQASDTVPVNPFIGITVSVYEARCPGGMVCEVGETDRLKSTTCSDRLAEVLEVKLASPP